MKTCPHRQTVREPHVLVITLQYSLAERYKELALLALAVTGKQRETK